MILEHKGELWTVAKSQSVKPGKGGAFNQVEMKNIKTGSKLNERFRASEEVERVRVDEEKYQYLYKQDDKLIFLEYFWNPDFLKLKKIKFGSFYRNKNEISIKDLKFIMKNQKI